MGGWFHFTDSPTLRCLQSYSTGVSRLWIGLIQDTMNGPYLWVDGSPVTFTNWMGGGQPDNNNGQELCANLAADTGMLDIQYSY